MKSQPSTHKRFLVGMALAFAMMLTWLVVIERAEAGPSHLVGQRQEILPSTGEWNELSFAGSENQDKWNPDQSAGDWLFVDNAIYVQQDTAYINAFSTFEQPVALDYQFRVNVRYVEESTAGGGILFNAPARDSIGTAYVVRFKEGGRTIEWGHFADDGSFQYQNEAPNPIPIPGGSLKEFQNLEVRVQGDSYTVLTGDRNAPTVIAKDIAFAPNKPSYFGLTTSDASIEFQAAEIWVDDLPPIANTPTPTPSTTPTSAGTESATNTPTPTPSPTETSTPTPTTTGTPDVLLEPGTYALPLADRNQVQADWTSITGVWDTADSGAGYRHQNVNSQDGITYYKSQINGDYEFDVDFKIEEKGSSPRVGILFNVPDRTVKNGAYVIRYDGDRTIEWGLFDNTSNYVAVGSKTYGNDIGEDVNRLGVKVASNQYSIRFNGNDVDTAIGIRFEEGYGRVYHPYIGLYASYAKAIFNQGDVLVNARTTPTATPPATFTPTNTPAPNCNDSILEPTQKYPIILNTDTDWQPLSGGWENDPDSEGKRQVRTDLKNATNFYARCIGGDYRIVLDFQVDSKGNAPAVGLSFNAANRSSVESTYVVRFDGDNLLDWGYINSSGIFSPEGDTGLSDEQLAPNGLEQHQITLSVTSDRYKIQFNGFEITDGQEDNVNGFRFDPTYPRVSRPYAGLYSSEAASLFQTMSIEVLSETPATPTVTPTFTATSTPTPTSTTQPTPTTIPTSTPGPTRTPTHTATATAPVSDSPLTTPTPTATWTSAPFSNVTTPTSLPTATFLPPPTPDTVATAQAAAMEQASVQSPLSTPTFTLTPMPTPTPTLPVPTETLPFPTPTEALAAVPPPVAIVVTATFTPTQRPIEPPTPTPTPDRLMLVANIVDSTIAAAGWIWFMFGSLIFFIVAGVLAGLSFRQREQERFDLVEPVELDPMDDDAILENLLTPMPPLMPPDEEEPPDDWPPSLP